MGSNSLFNPNLAPLSFPRQRSKILDCGRAARCAAVFHRGGYVGGGAWRYASIFKCEPGPFNFHDWQWGEQICEGPFQNALVNLKSSKVKAELANACGSSNGNIRELGTYNGHRVFGCGFGINPLKSNWPNRDTANKFGLVIPSRLTYRCDDMQDGYCMTR